MLAVDDSGIAEDFLGDDEVVDNVVALAARGVTVEHSAELFLTHKAGTFDCGAVFVIDGLAGEEVFDSFVGDSVEFVAPDTLEDTGKGDFGFLEECEGGLEGFTGEKEVRGLGKGEEHGDFENLVWFGLEVALHVWVFRNVPGHVPLLVGESGVGVPLEFSDDLAQDGSVTEDIIPRSNLLWSDSEEWSTKRFVVDGSAECFVNEDNTTSESSTDNVRLEVSGNPVLSSTCDESDKGTLDDIVTFVLRTGNIAAVLGVDGGEEVNHVSRVGTEKVGQLRCEHGDGGYDLRFPTRDDKGFRTVITKVAHKRFFGLSVP